MKFYSEKTNKYYDTQDECVKAEDKYEADLAEARAKKEALASERKARASEVEEAYKAVIEAQKNYRNLVRKFCRDYGSFHMTLRTGEENPFDLFESFFDRFW